MPIASTMTAYITSNFITGDSLKENIRIEATIVGVREHEFKSGDVKPTVDLDDGRRIPLNQTRLKALIAGFGPNPANWVGKTIIVQGGRRRSRGSLRHPSWSSRLSRRGSWPIRSRRSQRSRCGRDWPPSRAA